MSINSHRAAALEQAKTEADEIKIDQKFSCDKIQIPTVREVTSLRSTLPPGTLSERREEIIEVTYRILEELNKFSETFGQLLKNDREKTYVALLKRNYQNCLSVSQHLEATPLAITRLLTA